MVQDLIYQKNLVITFILTPEDTVLNDKSVNLSVFSKFPFGEKLMDFPFSWGN